MKTEAEFYSAQGLFFDAAASERASMADRAALLLDRSIYGALLFVVVLFAIPYGAVEPWWESLFEVVIFALAALWFVEGALTGSWRAGGVGILLPLLALA